MLMKLTLVPDATCETAWTDGSVVGYNPAFVAGLTSAERKGLLAHEVMHVAAGHVWRRGDRDVRRWNVATDYAINQILEAAGLSLPPGRLLDTTYAGLSAEAIYAALPVPPPDDAGGTSGSGGEGLPPPSAEEPGEGKCAPSNDPGGSGEVRDPPEGPLAQAPNDAPATETAWQDATLQAAMQAARAGQLPAGLERLVRAIRQPPCRNLLAALAEFAALAAREDYSWRAPNRRFAPLGLYLPSLHSEATPPILAAVDTSGSISAELLAEYVSALQVVLDELRPETLILYACDAAIQAEREYSPGDTLSGEREDFPGGGGTDFRPVFAKIAEEHVSVSCAVYLTDLDGRFPAEAPDYPVLWVVRDPHGARPRAPWGETLYLDF
jgi:predicted metal-dependent peptidase